MATDWYQQWLADKQKRDQQAQQNPQTNKVNFHQASMANNVQYTLPGFTGRSGQQGVNTQWEKNMLQPLSIKQYGRSYEDKFNNLTKSLGMSPGQADNFRTYLDSQEAAKQQYKLKNDGTPDNRHTVYAGQGIQTQNQQIDGILNNMTNPNTPTNQLNTAIQNAGIPDMKSPKQQQQEQDSKPHSWIYNNILNPVNNAVGGAVDYLERAGASGVDALTAGQFKKHINDASAQQALGTAGQQFAANETKDPTNLGQSVADVVGNLYATAPLFMGVGKAADPLAKLLTANKYGQAAIRGGLSMGTISAGQNAVDAAVNPNDATLGQRAKDVGLNTLLGAGADVGLAALGPVAQRIIGKLTKGKPVSQIAKEEGIPEEQVKSLADQYNYAGRKFQRDASGQIIDPNVPKLNAPESPPVQGINGPTVNPNQLGNTPLGLNEPLYTTRGVGGLGQDVQVNGTPQLNAPQYGRPIQSQAELDQLHNDMMNVSQQRQALEDQHVQGQLAPFIDSQKQQAQAEQTWNTTIKQAKEEAQRIKDSYGKIAIPKGSTGRDIQDQIPAQFKAAKGASNAKAPYDIYKFAEDEGFTSPEEAVQYLKQLDENTKVKLKDLAPNDGFKLNDTHIKALEGAARKGFADTSHGKAVDSLLNDLMGIHKAHTDQVALDKGNPLQFKKEVGVVKKPVSYTGKMNPKDQAAVRSEGSYSTKQVDSATGDTLKVKNTTPQETPLQFSRQAEQQGMKTKGQGQLSDRIVVKDSPKKVDKVLNDLTGKSGKGPKVGDTAYPLNAKGERMGEATKIEKVHTNKDGRKFYQFEGSKTSVEHVEPIAPKSEGSVSKTENVNNSQMLFRSNLQQFEDSAAPPLITSDKPIESKTAIQSIKNPVTRKIHSFIESAVNSTHSANIAERHVLENAIKDAKATGLQPNKVEQLKAQLKNVKKSGSTLEMSIQNEKTAGNKTKDFLEHHFGQLQKALGSKSSKDMADALRYQFAQNIHWIWENVNPEYTVGAGWDRGRVNQIINSGAGNTKLENFTKAMRNLTQDWRDKALSSHLITKAQHEALSKNPYYIPMSRDISGSMDNIARGFKGGNTSNKSQSGLYFVHALGQGDAEALYKNPMETIINNSFSLFKNLAKADTGTQALKLAKLDKNHLMFREVGKKEFDSNGGIAVPTAKGTKYVQLQDDLMKMYKENDLPLDLNVLGKITSTFSGAKVRSLQYQFTGVPRDLAEGYLKGQTNNPVKYLAELVKAAKNHNIDAKQAGAIFQHAYKDGMGGINQDKLVKEFAKQYKNVKPFDPKSKESWKGLVSTLGKIADMPFKPARVLGQLSDELPRSVEVKVTKQNFMKKYGKQIGNIQSKLDEVNQKIDATKGITDPFDPALQGIDKLQGQKTKLENMLNEFDRNLKREQTYRGRDLMNFSSIGRSGIAKHIKQYAAFANTGTQSKYKLARAFVERPVATLAKTALLTAPLVYAEKVIQQNLTGDDKKMYDNTPDYIKQYNYVYVLGGNVYTLPKIQELALITDPLEAILTGDKSALNSSARNAVKETVPYQAGNVAQGLVPNQNGSTTFLHNANSPLANTIFEPTIDAIANKKIGFNHNPVAYSDAFGRKNPKANKWTLDVFKGAFGNKPAADYAQYAVEQYGGDAGKYLEQLLNVAKSPKDKAKIDAAIQALNPAQDRAYGNITVGGHQVFKSPYKKSAITKK